MEKLYTIQEISASLKITEQTIRRHIKECKLKASKVGRQWRVVQSDLDEYVNGVGNE